MDREVILVGLFSGMNATERGVEPSIFGTDPTG